MTVEEWDDLMRRGRIIFWILMACGASCLLGAHLARGFIVRETARCLEAPDIDTARVCWDAATLGWKP